MGNSVLLVLGLFFNLVALQDLGCLTGTVVRVTSQPPVQGCQGKPQEHNLPAVRFATLSWFPVTQTASPRAGFPEAFHTYRMSACTMLWEQGHPIGSHDKTSQLHTRSCGFLGLIEHTVRRQSLSYTTAQPSHWEISGFILRDTYFRVGYPVPEVSAW